MPQNRRRTKEMTGLSKMSVKEIVKDPVQYELDWLRVMIDEAWKMYLQYGGEVADEETSEQYEIDQDGIEILTGKTVKSKTRNDPKIAMQLFDRIVKLQDRHRELMGVKSGDARDKAQETSKRVSDNGLDLAKEWNK